MQTSLASYSGITGLQATQSGNSVDLEITNAADASEFSNNVEISTLAAGQALVFGSFNSEEFNNSAKVGDFRRLWL